VRKYEDVSEVEDLSDVIGAFLSGSIEQGGTDPTGVFEWLAEQIDAEEERPLVIVMTDGYWGYGGSELGALTSLKASVEAKDGKLYLLLINTDMSRPPEEFARKFDAIFKYDREKDRWVKTY
jgi:hypothetical protein